MEENLEPKLSEHDEKLLAEFNTKFNEELLPLYGARSNLR